MISQYKAIIFDWDGTLVDSNDWVLAAHNHVRKIMNRPLWTKEDIFGHSSLSARETYPREYGSESGKAMEILYDYVKKHNQDSAKPYPHSKNVLQLLQDQKIPMGVVSNKRHEPLNEVIDYLEWRHFFKTAIGAGHAERDKPHSAPLFKALFDIHPQLKSEEVLYVGDSETDLLTAKNAGCDMAFVQSDKPRPDLIEKYQPQYAWDTLEPLLEAAQKAA